MPHHLDKYMFRVLTPLLMCAAGAAVAAEATLLDGQSVRGTVLDWDASGVVVASESEQRRLDAEEVLELRWETAVAVPESAQWMELVDGARLIVSDVTSTDREISARTPYASEPLVLPRESVHRLDLQPATSAAVELWRQIEQREIAGDVLLVVKRDGAQMDYIAGVIGKITADEVAFNWDGQAMAIKRSKAAGVRFFRAQRPALPEPVCVLTLADGARLPVRALQREGDIVAVATPAGAQMRLDLDQVVRADYSHGKMTYLSDLPSLAEQWTPRIALPPSATLVAAHGLPRRDVSFRGETLSLAWPDPSQP
ncbi:MAG TPA: hypothetical protein PJ982_17690, partial [Lacipirellulaceae bacterium]|nr:hypothetical protein [Lacipirellulaceae bacterium]